jgi:hypothetical protein
MTPIVGMVAAVAEQGRVPKQLYSSARLTAPQSISCEKVNFASAFSSAENVGPEGPASTRLEGKYHE